VDAQTPALRDLNASSGQLERFFDNLGPFADASRPSFRSLGEASKVGRRADTAAKPTVAELRRFARHTPELGKNLAIVLEDIADRNRAVEKDPRAPGENTGWNGLEAVLGYVFWQAQAINIFDRNGYILKVALYDNECSPYKSAESLKANPELAKHCSAGLGPTQPGVNAPDTSLPPGRQRAASAARAEESAENAGILSRAGNLSDPAPTSPGQAAPKSAPQTLPKPRVPIDIPRTIDQVLGQLPLPGLPKTGSVDRVLPNNAGAPSPQTAGQLLDYLLGS
jgi:hypothetical protein